MLNSTELETHKNFYAEKKFLLSTSQNDVVFIKLIKVKMTTIVGILQILWA